MVGKCNWQLPSANLQSLPLDHYRQVNVVLQNEDNCYRSYVTSTVHQISLITIYIIC